MILSLTFNDLAIQGNIISIIDWLYHLNFKEKQKGDQKF